MQGVRTRPAGAPRAERPSAAPSASRLRAGLLALSGTCLAVACAETEAVLPPPRIAVAPQPPPTPPARPYRPGETPVLLGDEPDQAVEVALDRGYLQQGSIDDVLATHVPRLSACYEHAGAAQLFAHGEVRLRFQLSAEGEVTDVLIIDNELGNYPVERCLVSEGRKIRFPAPGGGKAADFEYSMEFRSPRQKYVVIWRRGTLRRPIAAKMPTLGRCGSAGDAPVRAVAYIKPNGWVASVGLASDGPLEAGPARCLVDRIMRWRLRGDRGHIVRTSFAVSSGTRSAAAASLGPTARLKRPARRTRHD
jgi:hypothetical protein